jgi:hypothetical protein
LREIQTISVEIASTHRAAVHLTDGRVACLLEHEVTLSPLTYIQQPEYWATEVIGSVGGRVLPSPGAPSYSCGR